MQKMLDKTPVILDHDADTINDQLNQRRMKAEHYYNTYSRIANETVCDSEPGDPFFGRKSISTLLQLHPFIVLGPSWYIRLFDCGYRTFANWALLNESYDRESNSAKRTDMVLENIHRLCSMELKDCTKSTIEYLIICFYNREYFLKIK